MTTLVGIVSRKDEPVVILGADRQEIFDKTEVNDIQKILVSKDGRFAFAMTGTRDDAYERFAYKLVTGKINLRRILNKGIFPEFRDLNLKRENYREFGTQSNKMIVATRYGNPSLYRIWSGGKVEESERWEIFGTGNGQEFIDYHDFRSFLISEVDAAKIALEVLREANRNIGSEGYDLAVVRKSGIIYFGDYIQNEFQRTHRKIFKGILRKLKG